MFDRYERRVSADGSTPTAASLLDIVPLLSSAARTPFPEATNSVAVLSKSSTSMTITNITREQYEMNPSLRGSA